MTDAPTFDTLVALEPHLGYLEAATRQLIEGHGDHPEWCANAVWYGYNAPHSAAIRTHVAELVGWSRRYAHIVDPARHWRTTLQPDDLRGLLATAFEVPPYDVPLLHTSEAYDVAYRHLFGLLPDCRHDGHCSWWRLEEGDGR